MGREERMAIPVITHPNSKVINCPTSVQSCLVCDVFANLQLVVMHKVQHAWLIPVVLPHYHSLLSAGDTKFQQHHVQFSIQ